MVYANKFNENSDISTMYLGETMTRDTRIKAEERISHHWSKGFLLENC